MVLVQMTHLHMHDHESAPHMAHIVHVRDVQTNHPPHNQSSEIDLQFDGLITKVKIVPDLLPLAFFVSLILTILIRQLLRDELIISFIRVVMFSLRPPSRASP
jgi:hypothetical protein